MTNAPAPAISARDRYMLALASTPQLGPTRVRRLFERIPEVEEIFRASLTELEAAGLPAPSAQSIALGASLRLADEELRKLVQSSGVSLVTFGSELYPAQLAEIYDPPLVLYVRGDGSLLREPALAVMPSRLGNVDDGVTPIGVFRAVNQPTYDDQVNTQIDTAHAQAGEGDLAALLASGDTWTIN